MLAKNRHIALVTLLALPLASGLLSACENETAESKKEVSAKPDINSSSQAVSLASLKYLNGTYGAGCTGRSGGWSLPLSGYSGATDNTLLSVVTGDSTCTLNLTGIVGDESYAASPSIPLATAFAPSASAFTKPGPALVNVATLAGSGSVGYSNGGGNPLLAQFNGPRALAVDPQGNILVADSFNHVIRKIAPGGEISLVAGTPGQPGLGNGAVATSRFDRPEGIALDAAGNIYVADVNNHSIRIIFTNGQVGSFAGDGVPGSNDDVVPTTARFRYPSGLAFDAAGNLLVADGGNNSIRKITPAGAVTTVAGGSVGFADGPVASARFAGPGAIAVDAAGNIFVGDVDNNRVRKITPGGEVTTLAGDGSPTIFQSPSGLALDGAGNVFVSDHNNHRIRKIAPDGQVSTYAGSGVAGSADGNGTSAQFNAPLGIAIDGSGALLVTDYGGQHIRKLTSSNPPVVAFYANAKVNTADFSGDFVINLLISDDPGLTNASSTGVYASVSASAQTDLVPSPNYSPSTSSLSFQVNAQKSVLSVTGSLALTDGTSTASAYVINEGTLPPSPSYADYDAAFNAGTAVAITGANPAIAGATLLPVGTSLAAPVTRTVILRRSENGVSSYQAVKVTFTGP